MEIPKVVGLKKASFDTPKTVETIEGAAALPRRIGVLTDSDTFVMEAVVMGCDGAPPPQRPVDDAKGVELERLVARTGLVKEQSRRVAVAD